MKQSKKNKRDNPGWAMTAPAVIFWPALLVGMMTLGILVYSYIPMERIKKEVILSQRSLSEIGLAGYSIDKLPRVQIEYPSAVYAGDAASATMVLDPAGMQLSNSTPLVADYLMELDGANVGPDGDILVPIENPYPAQARWNLAPFRSGVLTGKIWLHLQVNSPGGEIKNYLLLAYPVEIQSTIYVAGSVAMVRLICLLLFFASFVVLLIITVRNWPQKKVPQGGQLP